MSTSTKVILIANPKGGSGKTTLADELAFEMEARGLTVSFANLDNQGGTIHETVEYPDSDILIIDTPGRLMDKMKDWAKSADIVLVPLNPSVRDLPVTVEFVETIQSYAPTFIVMNRFNPRFVVSKELVRYASDSGLPVVGKLVESTEFPKASMNQKGVVHTSPHSTAAFSVRSLTDNVLKKVGK